MSVTLKQIVVFHPAFSPTREIIRKMERAGYVVVIADPDHVRVIAPTFVGSGDVISMAALRAIERHGCGAVREDFGKRIISALLALAESRIEVPA